VREEVRGEVSEYPYVRAWGRLRGFDPEHVEALCEISRRAGAPAHAVYPSFKGVWVTMDTLWDADSRAIIEIAHGQEMEEKGTPLDYIYIRAWGWVLGAQWSNIQEQVDLARVERAPEKAICRADEWMPKGEGRWLQIDDVAHVSTRQRVEAAVTAVRASEVLSRLVASW